MDVRLELITGIPIIFNKVKIHQPKLSQIVEIGEKEYEKNLLPFVVDKEDLDIPQEFNELTVFDILTLDINLVFFLESIRFFCMMDEMQYNPELKRLYIGKGYIDNSNFCEFSELILELSSKKKEKKEKFMPQSEKQKEIWDKLQKGRKRQAEKSEVKLFDIINLCQFGGEYYIPIKDILDWTPWQLNNCYRTIISKSCYKDNFSVFLETGEKKLVQEHWLDKIKIPGKI